VETTAARYWSWFVVWKFLLDEIPLEKGLLSFSFLSFGSSSSSKIIYLSKVMVLGVVVCLWLGENIVILSMFKQAQ
jgi:hypothetical protein